MMELNQITEI